MAAVLWDGRVDVLAEVVSGLPTWGWRCAPIEVATRRQLRAAGLCPGGHEPAGRITCRRGRRWAWLYRLDLAAPKRTATPAVLAAVGKALAARRWCPGCRRDVGYCVPPVALGGRCWDCAQTTAGGARDAA